MKNQQLKSLFLKANSLQDEKDASFSILQIEDEKSLKGGVYDIDITITACNCKRLKTCTTKG
ncbi:MAG: hypothetical protein H6553_06890 [Chitinophagales bacterium]|nr:hypothetical protein [Chitinophagales bacterium]